MLVQRLPLGNVLRTGSDAETQTKDGTIYHVVVLSGKLMLFMHKGRPTDEPLVSFPVDANSIPFSDDYVWYPAKRTEEQQIYIDRNKAY